jgi:orotate phosphoribosyltransferase
MTIAKALLKNGAVKVSLENLFTWTSGISSPIYCDNRLLVSEVSARNLILDKFIEKISQENLQPEIIAGTATAGIPWASFLAERMQLPMVYVRPKPKSHGSGKQVEGTMKRGAKVLIIEDLFSTGNSSIVSAKACQREFEAEIISIGAIFSYGFPTCKENFETANFPYFSLENFANLLQSLELNQKDKEDLEKFIANPQGWRK